MTDHLIAFLKKDPLRRGMALFLAVLLYAYLFYQTNPGTREIERDIPLKLRLSYGLQESESPPPVRVLFRVPKGVDLSSFSAYAQVRVHTRDRQPDGRYLIELQKSDIKVLSPQTMKVQRILFPEQGMLRISLLRSTEKTVELKPLFEGKIPADMELKCSLIPDKAKISGAENIVSLVRTVYTQKIPLENAPEFFEYEVPLALPAGVKSPREKVLARVQLFRSSRQMPVRNLPVQLLGPGPGLKGEIEDLPKEGVSVEVRGSSAALNQLRPASDLRVFADVSNWNTPGRRRVKLHCFINLPGVQAVSLTPGEVVVKITKISSR